MQIICKYQTNADLENFSGVTVSLNLRLRDVSSQDPTFEGASNWAKHVNVVFNESQIAADRLNYGNYIPMVTLRSSDLLLYRGFRPETLKSGFSWYLSRDYAKKS